MNAVFKLFLFCCYLSESIVTENVDINKLNIHEEDNFIHGICSKCDTDSKKVWKFNFSDYLEEKCYFSSGGENEHHMDIMLETLKLKNEEPEANITCIPCFAPHKNNPGDLDDILEDYWQLHNKKHRTYRQVRECQHIKYGNLTHTKVKAQGFGKKEITLPIVKSHHSHKEIGWSKRRVQFRLSVVSNPYRTLSVLEPLEKGSCHDGSGDFATVKKSAEQKHCLIAVNAGFFNTSTHGCLGNIVSNGRLVQDSGGIQNAQFGITRDGRIFIGYLSEIDVVAEDFIQLVAGMVWLVRDGEVYVEESREIECPDVEETGSTDLFINIISARTAVGVDKEGRVIIAQVDGQSYKSGVNLYEFAKLLVDYGVVNAINLDGGGSATYVVNNSVVNYPSDVCPDDKRFRCAREVSTIICAHEPDCTPADCSGHGECHLGVCQCVYPWTGKSCNKVKCDNDCSQHGLCSPVGCICHPGWHGYNCSHQCLPGYYGIGCRRECVCLNSVGCNPVDGTCHCKPGFTGTACEKSCPPGKFGSNCKSLCLCDKSCPCHPVSGSCSFEDLGHDFIKGGQCYANNVIKEKKLIPDHTEDYRLIQMGFVTLGLVAAFSVICNILLGYTLFTKRRKPTVTKYKPPTKAKSRQLYVFNNVSSTDDELSSLSDYPVAETSFGNNTSSVQIDDTQKPSDQSKVDNVTESKR